MKITLKSLEGDIRHLKEIGIDSISQEDYHKISLILNSYDNSEVNPR